MKTTFPFLVALTGREEKNQIDLIKNNELFKNFELGIERLVIEHITKYTMTSVEWRDFWIEEIKGVLKDNKVVIFDCTGSMEEANVRAIKTLLQDVIPFISLTLNFYFGIIILIEEHVAKKAITQNFGQFKDKCLLL